MAFKSMNYLQGSVRGRPNASPCYQQNVGTFVGMESYPTAGGANMLTEMQTKASRLRALLRAIDSYEGTPEVVAALQLMAPTFPRPGELRNASWNEFDLEAGLWIVPVGRMKMR